MSTALISSLAKAALRSTQGRGQGQGELFWFMGFTADTHRQLRVFWAFLPKKTAAAALIDDER